MELLSIAYLKCEVLKVNVILRRARSGETRPRFRRPTRMNQEQDQWPEQVRATLEECFDQIRFARAVDLARSRRFLEAEALLSTWGQLPDNPRDLDLLARMAAQQKQFAKARRCWESARAKDSHNDAYLSCLQAVAEAERTAGRWKKAAIAGIAAVILVTVILLAMNYLRQTMNSPPTQTIPRIQPAQPQQPQPAPVQPPQAAAQQKQAKPASATQKR